MEKSKALEMVGRPDSMISNPIGCSAQTVKTYFAYPKDESTENCVVVLPDVMGLEATNARL